MANHLGRQKLGFQNADAQRCLEKRHANGERTERVTGRIGCHNGRDGKPPG